ncbi:MAG: adenylate kinase [Deltaproteobacteria bacterium]|nr:adenylate kinase [Deltaproteobacteria bacterium]
MNVILLGPPGSGKGTQSALLKEKLKLPVVSTGNMLREAVAKKTTLGQKAYQFLKDGALVPDPVVVGIVEERLKKEDCREGYILDGFPRTVPQAVALEGILARDGSAHGPVINFKVKEKELVTRLTGRRVCKQCGAGFHVQLARPSKEGVCDKCGGELIQREDDREEAIRKRLKVYREETAPLIAYYEKRKLLCDIVAEGDVKEIFGRIEQALEPK